MAAAALTLAVIALARRDGLALRILLGLLCALTLVVLASALKRLELYEEAFGFTRLRLLAHAAILWLAALFAAVAAAGALHRTAWLPRATVALSALAALAFAAREPRRADRRAQRRALRGDGPDRPRVPREAQPRRRARARPGRAGERPAARRAREREPRPRPRAAPG